MEKTKVYQSGNEWQKNRYSFMSEYNKSAGIMDYGTAKRGNTPYYHLITEKDSLQNFLNEPEILEAVMKRFDDHKAGDIQRVLTNTVASQACCFNLFAPLQNRPVLTSGLFSKLLNKEVKVEHIEIEFTPNSYNNLKGFELNGDESLGDQSSYGGTDSDVAVFYSYAGKKGVILIEFKYIEKEFSVCGSYKNDLKETFRGVCDEPGYYNKMIKPNLSCRSADSKCGYLRYQNWQLTQKSDVFDNSLVQNLNHCPFRFSGQQLWRNMVLAENVAKQRKLDEFQFWVVSPVENIYLWRSEKEDTESQFRSIMTSKGNNCFRRLELKKDLMDPLRNMTEDYWTKNWLEKFNNRYLSGTDM